MCCMLVSKLFFVQKLFNGKKNVIIRLFFFVLNKPFPIKNLCGEMYACMLVSILEVHVYENYKVLPIVY